MAAASSWGCVSPWVGRRDRIACCREHGHCRAVGQHPRPDEGREVGGKGAKGEGKAAGGRRTARERREGAHSASAALRYAGETGSLSRLVRATASCGAICIAASYARAASRASPIA
ncbi:hypothetical protein AB1Y20_006191 [Prymnesium parvum]|uniref:Uncharacterized protein n=1 Tax=Prymnesium parvum TaxID=97485 RepID=A0AB34J3V5_PRYPA